MVPAEFIRKMTKRNMIKLSSPSTGQYWELPVLFEDESFFAVEKPAKLPTTPDPDDPERPTLLSLIHAHIDRNVPWTTEHRLDWIQPVHSLDADAGGVLLFARKKDARAELVDQFNGQQSWITYTVLAHGTPAKDEFEIDARLARNRRDAESFRVSSGKGKRAATSVKVLERFRGCALLECRPVPDRSHQVRVHLGHAGHPLVGDHLYGGKLLLLSRLKHDYKLKKNRSEKPLIDRPALHAGQLCFQHPFNGERVTIVAPPAKDISVAVRYLRKFAAA